jgi:large subunit ribosomal protein L19
MDLLRAVDNSQVRTDLPRFRPGDTVRVHVKIKEGDKYRIQVFEGVVIVQKNNGISSTFTCGRSRLDITLSTSVHSPSLKKEVVKIGGTSAAVLSPRTPGQSCPVERSRES